MIDKPHYLMLVQNPENGNWMLMVDTTDKAVLEKEFEGRVGSNIITLDTSDYVTIA